ncbi:hypothetical protein [Candidatus Poriferisodalis sp.]|uniref:hypothetical protein n=1 Tax=Candidatus Poriferisodalis sp. TaxID=3101277 RepID=UPI003B02C130
MEVTLLTILGQAALAIAPEYGLAALSAVCASSGLCVFEVHSTPTLLWRRRKPGPDEHGEGVISAAIAVLIIASLGALMWVGFKTLWESAEETTNSEIAKIGK